MSNDDFIFSDFSFSEVPFITGEVLSSHPPTKLKRRRKNEVVYSALPRNVCRLAVSKRRILLIGTPVAIGGDPNHIKFVACD